MMRAIPTAAIAFSVSLSATASAAPCDGFVDVNDSNASFCTAVTFMKNKGITLGCTDSSHYCPNDYVTRLQMALFLQRMGKGGPNNTLGDYTTTIGGGDLNSVSSTYSTVGGGVGNTASGDESTVGGGHANIASGFASMVAGGTFNTASGIYSTVGGGVGNTASGTQSFAAGVNANADGNGCFVFSDASSGNVTSCLSPNVFVARALNGFYFFTGGDMDSNYSGAQLVGGSSAWSTYSDRNGKENLEAVDTQQILDRLAALPMATWNWKAQGVNIRHMGPMAQDFRAAFGLGEDDKHITTVDSEGVALAAIQGLYAELKERAAMIAEQQHKIADEQREIADLRERVAQVESLRGELASLRATVAELREDRPSVAATAK